MRLKQPLIFAGSASRELSEKVCQYLGQELSSLETGHFSDGETWVKIHENVRGSDAYVIQSTYSPVNDNIMELLLIADALRRASAERINAVIPYFGYARQDRKEQGRVSLSAKVVANLIVTSGVDRVITLDLHSGQIQGFFDIPVDHLYASPMLVEHVKKMGLDNYIVVSPDVGNVKRARAYATRLGTTLAVVDKRRPAPNVSEVVNIIGDVKGKNVFLFDDLIDTAGTLCNAAEALIEKGATDVYACGTHPVFSGSAKERLEESPIRKIIVTDTIPQTNGGPMSKLEVVSVAPLIGEAVRRIYSHQSVSELFR
ncbi:MAG: ribose-phosphate pyrophosphokinase [bacterium]